MVRKIALALAVSGIATMAQAHCGGGGGRHPYAEDCKPTKPPTAVPAPELDPASAMGGLTLLLGGLVVLRGRRSKSSEV